MTEIYLVGGTTARTDLDNYVSANISEENAIASMRRWQDYQGSYEDYHIDHIEIDDIAEYDAKLLDKVMQKQRTIIDDDGVMYKVVLLKDIEDLKKEVSKNANES